MARTTSHSTSKRGLASADAATRKRVASLGGRSRGRKGGQVGDSHPQKESSSQRNEESNFWEDLLDTD